MKKQLSDQQSHDRRYQERKRAEAARRPAKPKTVRQDANQPPVGPPKELTKE